MLTNALRWDLSPLRPSEYWQANAREWEHAEQAMSEYNAGLRDAADEYEASLETTE